MTAKRHHARPLFLPHRQTFVATRPFRWKGELLECGDPVPKYWPIHHLRHLHTQSLIGPKDHPWTLGRHASWARRLEQGRKRPQAQGECQLEELAEHAEQADLNAEKAMENAEEARTMLDRIAGLFHYGVGLGYAGPGPSNTA